MQDPIAILRRAFEATVANWPLLLIRILEAVVMVVVLVGGFIVSLIPAGLAFDWGSISKMIESPEKAAEWLLGNAGVIIYLICAVAVLAGIAVLVHSFFEAGVVGAFVRYERSASKWGWRDATTRLSIDDFFRDAMSRGWRVFMIYNIVWGVAGLFLLVPLALILALVLVLKDSPAAIVIGCCGIALVLLVAIVVAVVAGAWNQLAITIGVSSPKGALESSSLAGDMFKRRLWHVVLVMIVMIAMSIGLSTIASTMNLAFSAGSYAPGGEWLMIPAQILGAVLNSIVSSFVGLWLASSFVLIVLEPKQPGPGGPSGN